MAALYSRDDVFRELWDEWAIGLSVVSRAAASGSPALRAGCAGLPLRLEAVLVQQLGAFSHRPGDACG